MCHTYFANIFIVLTWDMTSFAGLVPRVVLTTVAGSKSCTTSACTARLLNSASTQSQQPEVHCSHTACSLPGGKIRHEGSEMKKNMILSNVCLKKCFFPQKKPLFRSLLRRCQPAGNAFQKSHCTADVAWLHWSREIWYCSNMSMRISYAESSPFSSSVYVKKTSQTQFEIIFRIGYSVIRIRVGFFETLMS